MRIASALLTLAAVAALGGGAQAASVYSKIVDADCTVLKTYEDGGADLRCPGHDGLEVFVSEGDARLDVDFGVKSESFETFSAFNTIGDTVEWLTNADGVAVLIGLEHRAVRIDDLAVDARSLGAATEGGDGCEGQQG